MLHCSCMAAHISMPVKVKWDSLSLLSLAFHTQGRCIVGYCWRGMKGRGVQGGRFGGPSLFFCECHLKGHQCLLPNHFESDASLTVPAHARPARSLLCVHQTSDALGIAAPQSRLKNGALALSIIALIQNGFSSHDSFLQKNSGGISLTSSGVKACS